MARQRLLKPSFFTDKRVVSVSPLARLLWQGMWGLADREGRLECDAFELKVRILPMDACDVEGLLSELVRERLVIRYEVDGREFLAIPRFTVHQKPHPKEGDSTLPPPPDPTRPHKIHGQPGESTVSPENTRPATEKPGPSSQHTVNTLSHVNTGPAREKSCEQAGTSPVPDQLGSGSNVLPFPVPPFREEGIQKKVLSPPPRAASSAELEGERLWAEVRAELELPVEHLDERTRRRLGELWPLYSRERWLECFWRYTDPARSRGAQFAQDEWPLAALLTPTVLARKMPGVRPPPPPPPEELQPSTIAGQVWATALADIRAAGKTYSVQWLSQLRPLEVRNGTLRLLAPDAYFLAWVRENCGELLADAVGAVELVDGSETEEQAFG